MNSKDDRPLLVTPRYVAKQWREQPSSTGALTAGAGVLLTIFLLGVAVADPSQHPAARIQMVIAAVLVGGGLLAFGIWWGKRKPKVR